MAQQASVLSLREGNLKIPAWENRGVSPLARDSGTVATVVVWGGVAEFTEDTGSEDGNLQLATNNSKERRHWLVLTPPPTYTLVLCSCVCH